MVKVLTLLFGTFLYLTSYSQINTIQVERNISEYYIDSTVYSQVDFYYSNNTDITYVLWIEKDNVDSLNNSQKIKKHFYTRKGDMSLIQLIWDGNVASFVPGLFDSFMKVIRPDERFNVTIINEGKVEQGSDEIRSLERHIVIVNANEIKGLQIDDSINLFNYAAKSVTVLAEWLK